MRTRLARLRVFLVSAPAFAVALFVIASSAPAHATKIMLEGTYYPTRNGQAETNDNTTPYPPQWTPSTFCFKAATSITIRIVPDPGENIVSWQLTGADLFSFYLYDTFGEEYYWVADPSPVLRPDQTWTLPPLP